MASRDTIRTLRRQAAREQGWRCFYCQLPMWDTELDEFIARYGISRGLARRFRCTAEHVEARCDGGKDVAANIVAACLFCNGRRHRVKHPLDASEHVSVVRLRLAKGRWHPPHVLAALGND